jgi:hypothetical protein
MISFVLIFLPSSLGLVFTSVRWTKILFRQKHLYGVGLCETHRDWIFDAYT